MILIDKIINANSNREDGNVINEQDKQSIEEEQESINEITTNVHKIRILLLEKLMQFIPNLMSLALEQYHLFR